MGMLNRSIIATVQVWLRIHDCPQAWVEEKVDG